MTKALVKPSSRCTVEELRVQTLFIRARPDGPPSSDRVSHTRASHLALSRENGKRKWASYGNQVEHQVPKARFCLFFIGPKPPSRVIFLKALKILKFTLYYDYFLSAFYRQRHKNLTNFIFFRCKRLHEIDPSVLPAWSYYVIHYLL